MVRPRDVVRQVSKSEGTDSNRLEQASEYTQYGLTTIGGVTTCPDAVVRYRTILRVSR